MDAQRVSDGAFITLKPVRQSESPYEVDILSWLTSEPLRADPRNHSVPLHEVLKVPDDEDVLILVMPQLRFCNKPPFDTVGEAVEFFRQIFEVRHALWHLS